MCDCRCFVSSICPLPCSDYFMHNVKCLRAASLRIRLTEIRASQRTFEGAYMRTALSQFSFALIILKIFTSEFYAIGALFAAYGVAVLAVAIFRRYEGNKQFFDQEESDSESDDDVDVGEHLLSEDGAVASPRGRRRVQTIRKKFRTSGNSGKLFPKINIWTKPVVAGFPPTINTFSGHPQNLFLRGWSCMHFY